MTKQICYVTSNDKKYLNAKSFLKDFDTVVLQQKLSIDEIQSSNATDIAIDKAKKAYSLTGSPLFVNDASWLIPSLGGFPGPFMHYIVDWLALDDFLALMEGKADRRIILRDTIVYIDKHGEKVFSHDTTGQILTAPQGKSRGPFITQIVSLGADGKSIAEIDRVGYSESETALWKEFGEWLKRSRQVGA